jgi:branched-chain amino acid transport system permease protein
MDALYLAELAVNGALVGLMYALVAMGIVLIYKCSSVVNFAQGSMLMLGAFVTWAMGSQVGLPMWAAVPLSVAAMYLFGRVVERFALRPMVGQPIIMIIMLTLGLDLFLRGFAPAVWGIDPRPLRLGLSERPMFLGGMLINRAYLLGGAAALTLTVLCAVLFRTRLGVKLRAVSDDYVASWSVGIWVERAVGISWALAGAIAALGGALWATIQGVDWSLSLILLRALAVAILGGLDSMGGALLGGIMLGVLESVISAYVDPVVGSGTREVVAVFVILLTILVRPHGLFGREIIERV